MKLRALNMIGSGEKAILPGVIFDIDDKTAGELLEQGAAQLAKKGEEAVRKVASPVVRKSASVDGGSDSEKIKAIFRVLDALEQAIVDITKRLDQLETETIDEDKTIKELSKISGINSDLARALIGAGIYTADDILSVGVDDLIKISGIGKKKAEKLIEVLEQ